MSQLLFYNDKDDEMRVYNCYVSKVIHHPNIPVDCSMLEDMTRKTFYIPNDEATAVFTIKEAVAELDPTTMKRIAKYNKDKKLEELNYKIQSAEDRLKVLNDEMNEKEKKLDLIQNLGQQIWEDDCFNEDKYLHSVDDDYDDWED